MTNNSTIITPGSQSEKPDEFGFWDPVIGKSFSQYLGLLELQPSNLPSTKLLLVPNSKILAFSSFKLSIQYLNV